MKKEHNIFLGLFLLLTINLIHAQSSLPHFIQTSNCTKDDIKDCLLNCEARYRDDVREQCPCYAYEPFI